MPKLIDEQRLIDARSLMRVIMNHEISMSVCMTQDEQCGMARMRRMVIEDIHAAPTIEPEVRRGRWITIFPDTAKCLYCGWWQRTTMYNLPDDISAFSGCYRFCPACGAKMGEGE